MQSTAYEARLFGTEQAGYAETKEDQAREEGLFMPVNYEAGQFKIISKQPKHLYKSTWMLADRHEEEIACMSKGERTLNGRIQLIRKASLQQ